MVLAAGKRDQVLGAVNVIALVPLQGHLVPFRVHAAVHEGAVGQAEAGARPAFFQLLAEEVEGQDPIARADRRQAESFFIGALQNDEQKAVPLPPAGVVPVPPHEEVGHGQLGRFRRVLPQVPAQDFLVFEAKRLKSVQGIAVGVFFLTLGGNGVTSAKGRHIYGGFKVAWPRAAGQGAPASRGEVRPGCIDKGPAGA